VSSSDHTKPVKAVTKSVRKPPTTKPLPRVALLAQSKQQRPPKPPKLDQSLNEEYLNEHNELDITK
jgi:hypothetical protein